MQHTENVLPRYNSTVCRKVHAMEFAQLRTHQAITHSGRPARGRYQGNPYIPSGPADAEINEGSHVSTALSLLMSS